MFLPLGLSTIGNEGELLERTTNDLIRERTPSRAIPRNVLKGW